MKHIKSRIYQVMKLNNNEVGLDSRVYLRRIYISSSPLPVSSVEIYHAKVVF